MSYAPIYSKLHELEERLVVVESAKASVPSASTVPTASTASTDFDCSAMRKEIDDLLKVVSGFAAKDELPDVSGFATLAALDAFATKAELPDVSGFAPLAALDAFATKEELAAYTELSAKFDNLLNVVSLLNTKITEANEKIATLESA